METCVRRETHVKTVSKCRSEAPEARRGPREVVFFERNRACAGEPAGAKLVAHRHVCEAPSAVVYSIASPLCVVTQQ